MTEKSNGWFAAQLVVATGSGPDEGEIVRFQHTDGRSLTGPIYIFASAGSTPEAKIVFGDTPLLWIENPTDGEREILCGYMEAAAIALNEVRGGKLVEGEARQVAVAALRRLLVRPVRLS